MRFAFGSAALGFSTAAFAADFNVGNQTDWNTAVAAINGAASGSTNTINFTSGFTLTGSLNPIAVSNANVTTIIHGNNNVVNGASSFQGIVVNGTNAPIVSVSNLSVTNTVAQGGNGQNGQNGYYSSGLSYGSGGGGGGGGAGGGGLYVGSGANVTLSGVTFTGNAARGGAGGAGGSAQNAASDSVNGGNGGDGGGFNGIGVGGAGGVGGHTGTQGTAGTAASGNSGAGGGGGGGSGTTNSTSWIPNNAGGTGSPPGGDGGRDGAGVTNFGGNSGPGADGASGGSGGGAHGGAIYVATGGTLTINDTPISGTSVTGGAGGAHGVGQGPSNESGSSGFTGSATGSAMYISGTTANVGISTGTVTYSGTIDGTGLTTGGVNTALVKTGTGTLVLSGVNTYVGNTVVSGGILSVGANNNLGNASNRLVLQDGSGVAFTGSFTTSRAITVAGDPIFDVASGQTVTISSAIADGGTPGDVQKTNTGTLVLSAVNTYTGTTTITAGTLALTGNGKIATSSAVIDNGTFDISGITGASTSIVSLSGSASGSVVLGSKTLTITGGSGTFAGTISDGGAGGSVIVTGGTETLTGTNSYSGGTTVGQTLIVGSSASLGSGAIIFLPGSTIRFTGNDIFAQPATFQIGAPVFDTNGNTVTWSGLLSGGGDLAVTGGGTLILTNTANSYAGGTEIYGGATLRIDADSELGGVAPLQLGDATTLGTLQLANGFNLNSGRVITLNAGGGAIDTQTFNSTISQIIGGAGGLTKLGSGTLTLSGTNTYTGASSVNAGTLLVTGSSASSPITVASGGTLGGTGRVGATTVSGGGTLAPGVGGVGTLGVNGALSFAAGSTAAFDITPAAADKITATGSASLAGTLALSPIAGAYTVGTDLQLISATSVSGTFTNITGNSFTGLNSTIVYSATSVDLVLGSAGPAMFLFGTYGKTPNEVAAGEALAASPATSPLYLALGSIVTANTPAVATALNELTGEIHASLRSAAVQDSRIIRDTILGRMSLAPTGTQVWGAGFGGWGSIGSNGNASGFGHHADGLLVGVDTDIAPTLRGGVAGAYSENYLSLRNNDGSAYGNIGRVIFYLDWDAGDSFDVKVGADYGGGTNRVSRPVAALSETEHDHEHLTIGQIFGDIGYKLPTAYALFEPYADVNYVSVKSGGFDESGGIAALSGRRVEDNETYSTFGIRASGNAIHWDMMALTPRIEFGWEHAYNRFNPSQVMTFQSTAESFMVQGAPLERDTAVIGAGFDLAILPDVLLSLGYNGAFSSKVSYNAVRGGLQWKL